MTEAFLCQLDFLIRHCQSLHRQGRYGTTQLWLVGNHSKNPYFYVCRTPISILLIANRYFFYRLYAAFILNIERQYNWSKINRMRMANRKGFEPLACSLGGCRHIQARPPVRWMPLYERHIKAFWLVRLLSSEQRFWWRWVSPISRGHNGWCCSVDGSELNRLGMRSFQAITISFIQ